MSRIGKKFVIGLVTGVLVVYSLGAALAQHVGHEGPSAPASPKSPAHEKHMAKRPIQTVTMEGLKITLDVMTADEHIKMAKAHQGAHHGGAGEMKSHHFMVTLQDTASKEIISDAKVTFTVQSPSGRKETGKLGWVGDHYGGDIDLKGKGTYQVILMIESGGMEREAKFQYNNP